ncbi:MAG: excinuclease ABC subunit UvrC [Candidatus Lokiarchaeota archaeon]|nr:excinuclease ABC subunit UvrC [Candidatus Lokiarchaeota archaeon]
MNNIELQRKSLPETFGVYTFKNNKGKIIYIGKANNLRKRVSSYFLKASYNDPYYEEKIKELVKEIDSIEYIVTENEKEAYILENIRIKNYLPRYNVFMRDSKSYPWVAIFYGEEFPRIRVVRNPENYPQNTVFIGPYTDKKEIIRILRDLRKTFPYCSCKKKLVQNKRPCLYYQLKLCTGPCIKAIISRDYCENIKEIELFLRGEKKLLKNKIQKEMEKAAKAEDFEIAAFWRDKLHAIEHSTTSQNVIFENEENKDILGYYSDEEQKYFAMTIMHIREGHIMNKSSFTIDLREKVIQKNEMFSSIMEQFYLSTNPNLTITIVLPELYEGIELFREVLKKSKIAFQIRIAHDKELGLIRIARKNAKVIVEQEIKMQEIKLEDGDLRIELLEQMKEILELPHIPRVIEGFDISNIEGTDATGSMVYFLEGKPYKKNYRHYLIRSKSTPDDVAMMQEVIMRRYSMILERNLELPDLILVDGGKGQLNVGVAVLNELGIEHVPIIGLAKKYEEIYLPKRSEPLQIPVESLVLKLFQQIRDEAHRFAVNLHKKQREKKMKGSILDDIKGIGPSTRNKLLIRFGSVEGIKEASLKELSELVGKNLATKIKNEII